MHIEDRGERDFYENEAIRSDWNVNILKDSFILACMKGLLKQKLK